jgi:hypothetical protein
MHILEAALISNLGDTVLRRRNSGFQAGAQLLRPKPALARRFGGFLKWLRILSALQTVIPTAAQGGLPGTTHHVLHRAGNRL